MAYYFCMGDVHTLAGEERKVIDEVRKADDRFTEFKQKVADAANLTSLDAMITQLQNFKDQVCKRIEALVRETPPTSGGEKTKPPKIAQIRRYDVFPVKRLTSSEDIDNYVAEIRKKLNDIISANDGIQII